MAAFGLQFGHGLGLGLHERPIISRLNSMKEPIELQVGMVFALETYCPASDGFSAARIEEEVVVTAGRPADPHPVPGPGPGRRQPLLSVRKARHELTSRSTDPRPATDLFIGGKCGAGLATAAASTCSTRPPATCIASVADGTVEDALAAVDAADAAAAAGRRPRRGERAEILRRRSS